jgi:uncharacterized membrane protein
MAYKSNNYTYKHFIADFFGLAVLIMGTYAAAAYLMSRYVFDRFVLVGEFWGEWSLGIIFFFACPVLFVILGFFQVNKRLKDQNQ